MTEKNHPLSQAAKETFAFWDKQSRILEGRDPLQVLESTPAILGHLIAGLSESQLRRVLIPNKWSIQQIVLHLADMEWVFGFRIRTILGDDEPVLSPVDQASWATDLATAQRTTIKCLGAFSSLRAINAQCWTSLTPVQLQRSGIHQETGVGLSLERIRTLQAGHDLSHLSQIEERLHLLNGE